MKQVNAAIVTISELRSGVYLLWAKAPEIAALARPGQYVMVRCGGGQDMPLRRPLSVHRTSQDGRAAFLFAVVGRGTEWLAQRREGDSLDLFGPLGNGFEIHPSSRNLLLVAGGYGVAPLIFLAEKAAADGRVVTLLLGSKTAAEVYPQHLLPRYIKPITVTEDGSLGHQGLAIDFVADAAAILVLPSPDIPKQDEYDQIFACGPISMYKEMASRAQLRRKSVQVLLEAVLGCGVGACLSCTVETKQGQKLVCKDGPVFELNEIVWDKVVAPSAGRRY